MKKVIALILILAVLAAVIFLPGGLYTWLAKNTGGTSALISPDSTLTAEEIAIDPSDTDPSFSEGGSTHITLSDDGIRLGGAGAELSSDGKTVTIRRRGSFVLRGSMSDGRVVVDAPNGWVHLVLDGVGLHAADTAPIHIKNAGNVRISTTPGSVNYITDGKDYTFPEGLPKEEPFAAVYSAVDLVLCGQGSLLIEGNFRDAVHCKDTLILADIALDIHAKEDGLVAHDALLIKDATVTAETGGDALKCAHPATGLGGDLCVHSGNFSLRTQGDGIQADNRMLILDGAFDVLTSGGHAAGFDPLHSSRALKAGQEAVILGGSLRLDAGDDAIHSDGKLVIGGGEHTLAGAYRAAVARELLIAGGITRAESPIRGLVAETMEITGGALSVEAVENAIRVRPYVAGQDDSFRLEGDKATADGRTPMLLMRGGALSLSGSSDGVLRTRGDMTLAGGILTVSAPDSGGAPIVCDGVYRHTGGVSALFGSALFAAPRSVDGDTVSVSASFSAPRRAGETLALRESGGSFLIATAAMQNYSRMQINAPVSILAKGKSYSILRDVALPIAGIPAQESITGGVTYGSFTVAGTEVVLRDFNKTELPESYPPEDIL